MFNRAFVAIGNALSIDAMSTSWLATTNGAMFCLIIVSVWQYAGYMMLIYVAGFIGVSEDVLEAARIDGCTNLQSIVHISVPLMVSSFCTMSVPDSDKMLYGVRCQPVTDKRRTVQQFGDGGNACVQSGIYI